MDFHAELRKCLDRFTGLKGLIFVDPEGEAILYESLLEDPFLLQLAGAKMPILMEQYRQIVDEGPSMTEMQFESHFVLSIRLAEGYSITAFGRGRHRKGLIKHHLRTLAVKFNQEIV